ncbi:MAG: TGS domain-containing protein [bacterium]
MPANLTPQYLEAEKRFRTAKSRDEKIAALEEMLALIPRHKGTEKMQADIKSRLSKLRTSKDRGGARRKDAFHVPRDGAGQVIVIGPANSGKSLLVHKLTGAQTQSAPYPFTTTRPVPGMMPFENIMIQLVDTPVAATGHPPAAVVNMLRNADMALLVADAASNDPVGQTLDVVAAVGKMHVILGSSPPVTVREPAEVWKKTLLTVNKCDAQEEDLIFELVKEELGARFECTAVSAQTARGLENLKKEIFLRLEVVRVYSKEPGRPPDLGAPFVLPRGSTLMDLAELVHKDFAERLTFARVWGSGKFDGQKVQRDYVLSDRDIVELHL